jgi:hypothetical protein
LEYVESSWALWTNILLFALLGARLYDLYARSWLAHTGSYHTIGTIQYSECAPQNGRAMQFLETAPEGNYTTLLSYQYTIDNKQFNSTYLSYDLNKKTVQQRFYKGAQVQVYYSPKLPRYSFIEKAPSRRQILKSILFPQFVSPLVFLNLASCIFWTLFLAGT